MHKKKKNKKSEKKRKKDLKAFGKWHDIIVVIIAFFLTTVGGSTIGYILQDQHWKNKHREDLLQSQIKRSEEVYRDMSTIMYERLYGMRKLMWIYSDGINDEYTIDKRWDDYRKLLNVWNKNLGRNLGLLEIHFGRKTKESFQYKIHHRFRLIGQRLQNIRDDSDFERKSLDTIKLKLDSLDHLVYKLNLEMINSIKNGTVGQFVE